MPSLPRPDPLSAPALMEHIRALADTIGPRPAGQPAEAEARRYIRQVLADHTIEAVEEQPFQTRPTGTTSFILASWLALLANLLAFAGRIGRLAGSLITLLSAASVWRLFGGRPTLTRWIEPRLPSANLIARIPARVAPRHTVVLIGHVDSNKKQDLTGPAFRHLLVNAGTIWLATFVINGLAQALPALAGGRMLRRAAGIVQGASAALLGQTLRQARWGEKEPYVAGANDNASAVACLLGLGAELRANPLAATEVWLAFTGAEEVLCVGMQAFLDRYGAELRGAWFVDFEMVGTEDLVYVTHHSGLSRLNGYAPDPESLAWAERTAHQRPELGLSGRALVIAEEVGTLRGRGLRGICIAGVDADGWLANWHQESDISANIVPGGVERAARFVHAMLTDLDQR